MTSVQEMRTQVRSAYPSDKWAKKVDKMSDTQITAIFFRLKEQGRI